MNLFLLLFYSSFSISDSLGLCRGSFSSCLLQTLNFEIPDSCNRVGLYDLCLKDLICNDGSIGGLQSAYVSSSKLDGKLIDIKIHCTGHYSYSQIKGRIKANVGVSSLSLDIAVTKNSDNEYPIVITASSCSMSTLSVGLFFSGGVTGELLNLVSPLVEAVIKDNVKKVVCAKLSQLISADGTEMLVDEINPVIKGLIDHGHPDPHYTPGEDTLKGYINWATSLIGQANQFVFQDYSGQLGSCFFGDMQRSVSSLPNEKSVLPVPLISIIGYMTNGTGELIFDLGNSAVLPIPSTTAPNSYFKFSQLSVTSLDRMVVLDMLQPSNLSNLSLNSSLFFDKLDLFLAFSFCSGLICDRDNSSLQVNLTDATMVLETKVGAVQKRFNSLRLDQLTSLSSWLATVDFMNITSLSLNSHVTSMKIVGSKASQVPDLDSGISDLLDNAFLLLLTEYKELVQDLIYSAIQGPIRHSINKNIAEQLVRHPERNRQLKNEGDKRDVGREGDDKLISWNDFEPLVLFNSVAQQATPEEMNSFTNCISQVNFMSDWSREEQRGSVVTSETRKGRSQQISVRSGWLQSDTIKVSGLDSLYDFSLLKPFTLEDDKVHDLISEVGIGACDSDKELCKPLTLSYSKGVNESTIEAISNSFLSKVDDINSLKSAIMSIKNLHLELDMISELTLGVYRSLQLGEMSRPGCFVANFQGLAVRSLNLKLNEAIVTVGTVGAEMDKILDMTKILKSIFSLLGSKVSLLQVNYILSQYLQQSKELCASEKAPPSNSQRDKSAGIPKATKWNIMIVVFTVSLCLFMGLGFLLTAYYYKRVGVQGNDSKTSYSLLKSSVIGADAEMKGKQGRSITKRNSAPPALGFNSELSLLVRIFIPLIIVGNVIMFVYSNICMSAVVVLVTLSSGSYVSLPEPVFAFGLVGTIYSMWMAKVYILAFLVGFLSGLWPYVKLFSLLFCWVLPPTTPSNQSVKSLPSTCWSIPSSRRFWLLRTVEVLGKWGLLDFYVMVLMMCAFHLNLLLPLTQGQEQPLLVEVLVQPNFGFFSFLLATMASHALSHVILACHRHVLVVSSPEVPYPNDALVPKPCRLIDSEFSVPCSYMTGSKGKENSKIVSASYVNSGENTDRSPLTDNLLGLQAKVRVAISIRGKRMIVASVIFTAVGIVVATSLLSFKFEFKGLVGWLLEKEGQGKSSIAYSFLSVAGNMQTAAGLDSENAGRGLVGPWLWPQIVVMQICYLTFGFVAPLLQLLVLLPLWLVPLATSDLETLLVVCDTIGAWTALDVFCLSIAAALLEIRQFAAFMVGDSCSGIDSLSGYFLPMKPGQETKCFDVIAILTVNFIWLVCSALLLQLSVSITTYVGQKAVKARTTAYEGNRTAKIVINKSRARESALLSFFVKKKDKHAKLIAYTPSTAGSDTSPVTPLLEASITDDENDSKHQTPSLVRLDDLISTKELTGDEESKEKNDGEQNDDEQNDEEQNEEQQNFSPIRPGGWRHYEGKKERVERSFSVVSEEVLDNNRHSGCILLLVEGDPMVGRLIKGLLRVGFVTICDDDDIV